MIVTSDVLPAWPYAALALAGAAALTLAFAKRVGGRARRRVLAVAGALLVAQGIGTPLLGMIDGANGVVCCFAADRPGVLTSADGRWAARDGALVDLAAARIVGHGAGDREGIRPTRAVRRDSGSAWFGDDASAARAAIFARPRPLPLQLGDGTQLKLANPNGNCAVVAEEGGVAAVVVSSPSASWLGALVPLRGAGTIDFVDLRTGRTLRSVTVAGLDGFSCLPGPGGATLVGLDGGARWVLSQARWIKVFDVTLPRRSVQPVRALALADGQAPGAWR